MCIRDRLIVDVLKLDGLCVVAVRYATDSVRPHPFIRDTVPVSYTHLDVYKRQVYRQTMGNKPLLFGGGSPDTSGSEDLSGVQFINCLLYTSTDKKGKSAQDSIPYERMWPDGICRKMCIRDSF